MGVTLDNRYRIDGLVGEGGMGSVYRARHLFLARDVAVKVIHPAFASQAGAAERFLREAQLAAQIRSPHVVEVLDSGRTSDGRFYLAMELLEGKPLQALLNQHGRLALPVVKKLLDQLLAGLSSAHAVGVIHRDLKPENLWLRPPEPGERVPRLKILDFGIAKGLAGSAAPGDTQSGMVVGTPAFLAPEQAVAQPLDARADLYNVGLLAWVMLVGRHPFPLDDTRALVQHQAITPVPPLNEGAPEMARCPRWLKFVGRATQKDRNARYANAAEMRAALAEVEEEMPARGGLAQGELDDLDALIPEAPRAGRPSGSGVAPRSSAAPPPPAAQRSAERSRESLRAPPAPPPPPMELSSQRDDEPLELASPSRWDSQSGPNTRPSPGTSGTFRAQTGNERTPMVDVGTPMTTPGRGRQPSNPLPAPDWQGYSSGRTRAAGPLDLLGSTGRTIVGLVIVVGVLGGVGSAYLKSKARLEEQQRAAAAKNATDALGLVKLQVITEPPGARVLLDGSSIGMSPTEKDVIGDAARRVDVHLEGYESWSGDVEPRRHPRLEITLRKL